MSNSLSKTPGEAQTATHEIVRLNETRPTEEAYGDILLAFQFFNDRLFENKLSTPLITFARKPRMLGAFHANRFKSTNGDLAHEIILNPHYLALRSDRESLSTLVHEMVHQWRAEQAPDLETKKPPSGGYHDAIWADGMERIGLMPSDTGEPGGKRIGPRVTHYITDDGLFDRAARALLDRGYIIRWSDKIKRRSAQTVSAVTKSAADKITVTATSDKPQSRDRIKFTCTLCGLNAWAKPSAELKCAPCDQLLIQANNEAKRT